MKNIKKWSSLLAIIFITGCSDISQPSNEILNIRSELLVLKGEYAVQLSNKKWINYGQENAITFSDENFNVLKHYPINAEYIDQKEVNGETLVMGLNNKGQLVLINQNTITTSGTLAMPIEGLCLYQPNNGALQVFLLDENAIAHQYLIKQKNQQLNLQLLRVFSLPPGAENCSVHDASDQLFVNEEHIGVWSYNARAESEVKRQFVDLITPFGELQDNAGPLVVTGDALYVAEYGSNRIHEYHINGTQYTLSKHWHLPKNVELDSLSAKQQNDDEVMFIAFDESIGQLIHWKMPLQTSQVGASHIVNVPASGQTTPVMSQGDAADDPAIWVHPQNASQSLILGTNKKRGLYVYDLDGKQRQELLVDRVNNVDVRQGFTYLGQTADIAAASQRDRQSIALFHINPNTGLLTVANEIQTSLDNVYGLCMYKGRENKIYVFINDEDGRYEQWHISDTEHGWQGSLVREFSVATQPEGCTTDEAAHRLFIGEENVAIWTLGAEPSDSIEMKLVASVGDVLTADIEGMEVYTSQDKNWLVVSSQGNDSYVILEAHAPYTFLGEFRVSLNGELGIDGASETDGLTLTSTPLGERYPQGLLVVQDGRNFLPQENQNFKLVSWQDVINALKI